MSGAPETNEAVEDFIGPEGGWTAASPRPAAAEEGRKVPARLVGVSKPEDEAPFEPEKCTVPFAWPKALNGIGDGMVLFGEGEKPTMKQYVQDALAGTTVAMILVPEAVAFAFMAGLNPLIGLQAAWIMCLVAGLAGDRPAMISGATGAVAVVLPQITQVNLCTDYLVKRYDSVALAAGSVPCIEPDFATPRRLGMLFYAVMLQGVIQFLFGMFKLGKVALLLPHPTMVGFCNGLGIIIFFAQFGHFKRGETGLSYPLYCQTAFDGKDGAEFIRKVNMTTQEWCSSTIGLAGQLNSDDQPFAWPNATAGRRQLGGSHSVFSDGEAWHDGQTLLYMVIFLVIPVIVSIHAAPQIFKRLPGHNEQLIPSSLVGIGISMIIEHLILRNADSDCNIARNPIYDFDNTGDTPRALWIGCGTKTVSEVAMVAGHFPVPFWFDSSIHETFPGSGVSIKLMDAIPPLDGDLLAEILPVSIFLAVIGLIESLMTQILLNQMLGTPGDASRECVGQGIANLASGALGSMGGCVTIGQAMINVGSGAKLRFSSCWAAFILLLIVLVCYPVIDLIPVGGLVGVMFDMVAFHIFEWGSLRMMLSGFLPMSLRKTLNMENHTIDTIDTLTIIIVAVVSIFTNLAIGVGCGLVLCALAHSWRQGGEITAVHDPETHTITFDSLNDKEQEAVVELGLDGAKWDADAAWEAGEWPTDEKKQAAANELGFSESNWADLAAGKVMRKTFHIQGTLFFGSARVLLELFTSTVLDECPKHIDLQMSDSDVKDLSALATLDALGEMAERRGKKLHVKGLSAESVYTFNRGAGLVNTVSSVNHPAATTTAQP